MENQTHEGAVYINPNRYSSGKYKVQKIKGKEYIINASHKHVMRRRIGALVMVGLVLASIGGTTVFAMNLGGKNAPKIEKTVTSAKKDVSAKETKKAKVEVSAVAVQEDAPKGEVLMPEGFTGDFIRKVKDDAVKVANEYGLYPSVMIAQAICESDYGRSELSAKYNNFFGVKARKDQKSVVMRTGEHYDTGYTMIDDAFAVYDTIYDSMESNAILLRNGISGAPEFYNGAWRENASSYKDAANYLTKRYATAPDYGETLISIIHTYGLNYLD